MKCRPPLILTLLLITAALFLPGTGALPLMDRDEPRFARATVEMMERSSWAIPWFNETYRFDKPPLVYWWMRLHYWLLGPGELAARLHSVVAASAVAGLLALMGRRFFSRKAGWVAALTWLTSFQVLVHGRLCVADMPMVLAVTAVQWALLELLAADPEKPAGRAWFWVLWVGLGIGFLAKGPIALLVPGLTLVLWRLVFWRKALPWKELRARWGWLAALLPVAAWGIPALVLTKGEFWNTGIGEHVIKRGTAALNGRVIIPFYYVVAAGISLLPWIAWLPQIIAWTRREWNGRLAFLVSWFLAPQLIFFFYATQLPHYTMPGFPAFFLLLGAVLAASTRISPGRAGWIYLLFIGLLGAAVITAGATLNTRGIPGLDKLLILSGSMFLLLAALGGTVARRWWRGAGLGLLGLIAVIGLLGFQLRSLHPLIAIQPLLQYSATPTPPSRKGKTPEAIAWGYTEPSLVFYGNRPWKFQSKATQTEVRLQQRKAEVAITLYQEWTLVSWLKTGLASESSAPSRNAQEEHARFAQAAGDGYDLHWSTGLNLARSSLVKLAIWKRKTP